jgi:hypothetical protein
VGVSFCICGHKINVGLMSLGGDKERDDRGEKGKRHNPLLITGSDGFLGGKREDEGRNDQKRTLLGGLRTCLRY